MDNSETLATLGTQEIGRRQTAQKTQCRKRKRYATRTTPKTGMNPRTHEGQAVPTSYKTPTMLLIEPRHV